MKSKRFAIVGKRLITVSVVTGLIAIAMALAGFSFYAIVFQSIFQALFVFLWNYWNTKLKFRPRFDRSGIRKIQQYSTYQFSYSIINYFARNLDNLLIGKVLGGISLAYYDKGYRLMMYPVQNLTYVINPILHPILSDYQHDKGYIYNAYMKVVRILSLMGLFISFYCFWASEEIILFFFGDQWHEAVPIFRMLSLSVWPQLVSTSAGSIYQSTGNTKLMLRSGTVHFSTTIALIVLGVLTGDLETVALLVSISLYLRFFIDYYFLVVKGFGYGYGRFLKSFRGEIVILCAQILAVVLGQNLMISGILHGLAIKALILGGVFLITSVLTGQLRDLLPYISRKNR